MEKEIDKNSYQIVKCERCGMLFIPVRETDDLCEMCEAEISPLPVWTK